MTRQKAEMTVETVPVAASPQEVMEREQMLAAQLDAFVQHRPDSISWDVADVENEALTMRAMTDPGIAQQIKDGWRGVVRDWWIGLWESADQETRMPRVDPCLVIIDAQDNLVRLTGWPAISSWSTLLRAAGIGRVRQGIPVVVRRRPSGTVGRSYWIVLPDFAELKRDNGGGK